MAGIRGEDRDHGADGDPRSRRRTSTTEALFKKHGLEFTAANLETYQSEENTQILARALVDPEKRDKNRDPERLFKSADELRAHITHPTVKAALAEAYNAWQAECSPSIAVMTEEQYDGSSKR